MREGDSRCRSCKQAESTPRAAKGQWSVWKEELDARYDLCAFVGTADDGRCLRCEWRSTNCSGGGEVPTTPPRPVAVQAAVSTPVQAAPAYLPVSAPPAMMTGSYGHPEDYEHHRQQWRNWNQQGGPLPQSPTPYVPARSFGPGNPYPYSGPSEYERRYPFPR